MKLIFKIDYHTCWGESIYIVGSIPSIADGTIMRQDENGIPTAVIEISPAQAVFEYRYEVRNENGNIRREWGAPRTLRLDAHLTDCLIIDRWQDTPSNKPFFSSAFTKAIFRRQEDEYLSSTHQSTLEIRVDAPMIEPDEVVAIAGSCEILGNWNPSAAFVMNSASFPVWTAQIPLSSLPEFFEYKFLVLRKSDKAPLGWEQHENRSCRVNAPVHNGSIIESGLFFENPLPLWHGTGTAIPVFSLRSEKDFGVGEFLDLKQMVDWAVKTGQQFIQLLPVNDTTMSKSWTDSYPYTTNSTFALHPMYIRLDEVGPIDDPAKQTEFDTLRRQLNELPALDYERVNKAKSQYLHLVYERQGKAEMTSEAFRRFAENNDYWLNPYAAWSVLRDRYSTADMNAWEEFAVYDEERIARFISQNRHDIDYYRFVQFHLDKQLREVRDYAASRGVVLKGDIPIGISRCSVDAWLHPELFNLDCSAGAPPDDFATLGQNWGFPTYRWDVMKRDGYSWWKNRLRKMAEYFSAYRIDHLLGFFRIWQIPNTQLHGLLGTFSPALPLSPEEMLERYGFFFSSPLYTAPYITDEVIVSIFGDLADEVKAKYLVRNRFGLYSLTPSLADQRDIAWHFGSFEDTEHNRRLCSGLMDLIDEVLFIEDPVKKQFYHPRIDAKKTFVYNTLSDEQRERFDELYEDFFYHRHNEFWKESAMEKLPALIDSTGMLCCAEDLGMIPACVPDVMKELMILSLEIQRMPKEPYVRFADPKKYPYLSVCSTSTHDMPGIRQWWEEDHNRAQKFYNEMLHHEGKAPGFAEPWICREILEMTLEAPSMLCILPLQDWLSIDKNLRRQDPREEQINVPADSRHYWRYRMHLTLERLLDADEFNQGVKKLASSRRPE